MRLDMRVLLAASVLLAAGPTGLVGADEASKEKAIAAIKRMGGTVKIDAKASGKPVVKVGLAQSRATDEGLACLKEFPELREVELRFTLVTGAALFHLKGLNKLQVLNLYRTRVGDKGLEHLKDLPALSKLNLQGTQVTDEGLEHLKGMKQLTDLNLSKTKITDKGLEHLKGLTKLETLELVDTRGVTEAGVKALKKALPKLDIVR